jgi:DNA invertase Pin-like site-specific DNA recombinase
VAAKQRAIGYLRVSTTEQVDGFGLDVQEQAVRSYCKLRRLRLVGMFSDEGLSGSNGLDTRVGLGNALAAVEAGEATAIVVYGLDRLARDLILQEVTIQRMHAIGAAVLSVSEADTDSDDPAKVMVRQMWGVFAQYERCLIRGRMSAGKAAKKAVGGYVGGRPAYGYKAVNGELVEDEDEAAILTMVTSLRRDGASYRMIVSALSEAGHTTRYGRAFTPATVRNIAQRAGVS